MQKGKTRKYGILPWICGGVVLIALIVLIILSGIFQTEETQDMEEMSLLQGGGDKCDRNTDCIYGICVNGYCYCESDHGGDTCSMDCVCSEDFCTNDECCGEHGACGDNGMCYCSDGYSGEFCEVRPICMEVDQICDSDDDCSQFDVNAYCYCFICRCSSPKYWGDHCELKRKDISHCLLDSDCTDGLCLENECYCPHGNEDCNVYFLETDEL